MNTPLLTLVDFRVYAWKIQDLSGMVKGLVNEATYSDWVKACWAIMLNQGPLPVRVDRPIQVLIVDDDSQTRPYWRCQYLSDRGFPVYKGNRPAAKPFGYSEIIYSGLEYIRASKSLFHYMSVPGFEADDLAGLCCQLRLGAKQVVRVKKLKLESSDRYQAARLVNGKLELCATDLITIANREIALSTLDTDWLQLVSPGVTWFNTSHQEPRVRGEREVIDYIKRRLKVEASSPRGIVKVKATKGDSSDNLKPGSPVEVIDLLNPPEAYKLIDTNTGLSMACIMAKPRANARLDHYESAKRWIEAIGLPLPIATPSALYNAS